MSAVFFLPVCELNTSYCLFRQKEIQAGVFLAHALFAKSIQVQIRLGHLVDLTLTVAMTSSDLMNPLDSNIVAHYHRNMSRSKDRSRTVATWHRGIVRKSNSAWSSPVVLVTKKDGLRIENSLSSLSVAKWFSTFDLASGYWQFLMDLVISGEASFCNHFGTL